MTTLLIASNNPGKIREIRSLLDPLELTLLDPNTIGIDLQVEETGTDYAQNARLKATVFAKASGLWTLADDSGLEVDALEEAPGLHSARLAGPGRSDAERRHALLNLLFDHPRPWKAHFRCVVALVSPQGNIDYAEGTCPGEIIPDERGSGGFGYDSIFLLQETCQTMAELSSEQKNRVSHRARAIKAITPALKKRLVLE